jgi:hypothetical protein
MIDPHVAGTAFSCELGTGFPGVRVRMFFFFFFFFFVLFDYYLLLIFYYY